MFRQTIKLIEFKPLSNGQRQFGVEIKGEEYDYNVTFPPNKEIIALPDGTEIKREIPGHATFTKDNTEYKLIINDSEDSYRGAFIYWSESQNTFYIAENPSDEARCHYMQLEEGKLVGKLLHAGSILKHWIYYLPSNDERLHSRNGTRTENTIFSIDDLNALEIFSDGDLEEEENNTKPAKPIPDALTRVYNSTFGFHTIRTLFGLVLTAGFLALLLLSPALMPLPWLTTAAMWLQNTLVPLATSTLGLGSAANTVIGIGIVGGFFTFNTPKLVGNLIQLTGSIVWVLERLSLGLFALTYLLERLFSKLLFFINGTNEPNEELFATFLMVISLIPNKILFLVSTGLNILGTILAGEYGYPPAQSASKPEPIGDSSAYIYDTLSAIVTTQDAEKTAQDDPAIFFPEERQYVASQYTNLRRWLDKSLPTENKILNDIGKIFENDVPADNQSRPSAAP